MRLRMSVAFFQRPFRVFFAGLGSESVVRRKGPKRGPSYGRPCISQTTPSPPPGVSYALWVQLYFDYSRTLHTGECLRLWALGSVCRFSIIPLRLVSPQKGTGYIAHYYITPKRKMPSHKKHRDKTILPSAGLEPRSRTCLSRIVPLD